MIGLTMGATTSVILGTFNTLGLTPPKAILEARARAERVSAGSQLGRGDGLPRAVARAIDAGADPATDPEVARLLTLAQLASRNIGDAVTQVAKDDLASVFTEHSDAIVKAWRKPFDQAAATLAAAHGVLGSVELEQTADIISRGGTAADAWVQAQTATGTIDVIQSGWTSLAGLQHVTLDRQYFALRTADIDVNTWLRLKLTDQKLKPWQVVSEGLTLSLPTMREYLQRAQGMAKAIQDRQEAAQQEHTDRQAGRLPRAAAV